MPSPKGFSKEARARQAEQLTAKERIFVDEYLREPNACEAAVRAGYAKGNRRSCAVIATQLLKKPKIQAQISAAQEERARETRVDAKFILLHLAEMAHADIGDIIDELGNYKPIHQWPRIWRQMLNGCDIEELYEFDREAKEKVNTGRVVKLKFVDRMRVIELLGRHIDIRAWQPDQTTINNTNISLQLRDLTTDDLRRRHEELSRRIAESLARQSAIETKALTR